MLVHAGAGEVGGFAIQIARMRRAGAEGRIFDAVLDTLGGAAHRRSTELLKRGRGLRAAEAHELSRAGHARGKTVLALA